MSTEAVVRAVLGAVSDHRAMRVLASLTSYNRVQGTIGLVDAAKHVQEVLLQEAGDSLEVELIKFGGTNVPDWMSAPTGWAIHEASVKVEGEPSSPLRPTRPSQLPTRRQAGEG